MKCNRWTVALLGAGLVSLPSVTQAEEKPSSVLTALSSTTISGYVDTSAQWNIGTGNVNTPPYAFGGPAKADGFNLNVVKLTIEKPVDPAETWGAGYKVDLIFGPDANAFATQSFYGNNANAAKGDFGVKQAYVALHAPVLKNGLDFKIGVWDTIIGYEVFESGNNPNFTRSYGYTLEPVSHTGLLTTYTVCEALTVNFGIANTVGPQINGRAFYANSESYKAYMGSVVLTAPKNWGFLAGSTLTGCIINGFNAPVGGNTASYYAGASLNTPVTGLKLGFAFDALDVAEPSGENWAVGTYVSVQASEKLSFYGRAEYLKDRGAQKAFVTTAPDSTGTPTLVPISPDEVLALTATAQYDLWKNVMTRLELRWDHALVGPAVYGGTTPVIADVNPHAGGQKDAVMMAINVIYKF